MNKLQITMDCFNRLTIWEDSLLHAFRYLKIRNDLLTSNILDYKSKYNLQSSIVTCNVGYTVCDSLLVSAIIFQYQLHSNGAQGNGFCNNYSNQLNIIRSELKKYVLIGHNLNIRNL